jgi:hypothetical protein
MFYNVSVQAAFAMEDPNVRFVAEFQEKAGLGIKGAAKIDDVESKTYEADVEGGKVALHTNPPNSPALSRVVMYGGRADAVIDALRRAFAQAENFRPVDMPPLPPAEGITPPEGAGNQFMRLVINDDLQAQHDVAALFAWGASSDKSINLEIMAWPMMKAVETNT